MENNTLHKLGIDIGSTTVKVAVLDEHDNLLFSDYERHFANIRETLSSLIQKAFDQLGDRKVAPMITGSGGLTLAKHLDVPFVQEVISVSTALQHYAPQTDVAIELGGEDAKIIYFEGGNVEQRMNGICAGGTGSFIDQMASLIQTDASGLNEYAKNYKAIYPIAARCGVFAKTDIQPLINEGATREDLSASIFQAVVNQTISGLACGKPIRGHVAFLGGPLHFLSELKVAFIRTLNLDDEHAITPDNSHLYAAIGSALNCKPEQNTTLSSKFKTTHHPNHVSCKIPHSLHTFFILRSFFSVKTMYHVPIGRTGDWHLCNPKIFIDSIKHCCGSSSSCYCNSSTRFKFEGVITSGTVKNSVQKIINTSAWMCEIYWCCKYKAICCFSLFNKFIHAIIFNHAFSCFLTDITLKTICYRLSSKLNNLCFYFF